MPRRPVAQLLAAMLALGVACGGDDLVLPDGAMPARLELANQGALEAPAGTALPEPVAVRVLDGEGRAVPGVVVAFSLADPGDGGALSADSVAADHQGTARTGWTLGGTAGTQRLDARVPGAPSVRLEILATATAGVAGTLTLESPPGDARIGEPLSPQPVLQLRDALGNPVPRAGIAVQALIASGPAGAELVNATAATDDAGRAEFAGLTIVGPVGEYRLGFSGAGLAGVTSDPVTLAAGAATGIGLVRQPGSPARSGERLSPQPMVQLVDARGNPVRESGVPVVAAIATGGGTLTGTTTRSTDGEGRAEWSDLAIEGSPGTRTLRFDAGFAAVTSAGVEVLAGGPDPGRSELELSPSKVVTGERSEVTVTVRDASGSRLEGVDVRLAVSGGSADIEQPGRTNSRGEAVGYVSRARAGDVTVEATADGVELDDREKLSVAKAETRLEILSDDPDPSWWAEAVDVRWEVTVESPGAGTPTGTVTVEGPGTSCSAAVEEGGCELHPLASGELVARYGGDDGFESSEGREPHRLRGDDDDD